jgi:3-methyladenine DNA glycosylase AlkC
MQLKQLKIENKRLSESLRVEIKAKNRVIYKLNSIKQDKDIFYKKWIQDHKKANNYKRFAIASFMINVALLVLFLHIKLKGMI